MKDAIRELFNDEEISPVVRENLHEEFAHGILVSNLSVLLAKELGQDSAFCKEIAIAGVLHDIGKLKINKYLEATKEDTLLIEQMKYVRMHSTFSYNILKREGFSDVVTSSAYHHHENYDGSGYPDSLKGDKIPFGARILRVSDVFSALVSRRSYRDAFDVETTVELMIEEVSNYDMRVFLAFQRVLHSDSFISVSDLKSRINSTQMAAVKLFEKEAMAL